ncbi:MAG: helix-turn-helix transcriptional regulator [Verrucomicrobia bacterium]|nr:helix-turn-helix transcriptional regulator [Verrucomicrobiota bacterium]
MGFRRAARSKHRLILGQNIRCRQRAALSQEKLEEKAELSTVFINRVEAGKENISVDALQRVAKSLQASLRDIFEGC